MRARELRSMRLDKRLTQADVAASLKVSQSYYSSIETGQRPKEVGEAAAVINRMRFRGDRTGGGEIKAGRKRS